MDRKRASDSAKTTSSPPFGGSTDWIGTAQAKLDWSLDFWGKQSAMVAMAQRSAEAAELDMAAARLALAGVLTQTYIDLARSCALRDLAAATVKQRASILELTNTRVRNGLESTTAQKMRKCCSRWRARIVSAPTAISN